MAMEMYMDMQCGHLVHALLGHYNRLYLYRFYVQHVVRTLPRVFASGRRSYSICYLSHFLPVRFSSHYYQLDTVALRTILTSYT